MSKINLFEDKEYDNMEWLGKAVEPFIFPQNEVLASIPERIDLTYEDLVSLITGDFMRINGSELLVYLARKLDLNFNEDDWGFLRDNIKVEVDPDTVIDFEEQTLKGGVRIIKTKNEYSEQEILEYTARFVRERLKRCNYSNENLSRYNEIMDLLGAKEDRQGRSARYKLDSIVKTMVTIVEEDKWRVRNVDLFIRCAGWIVGYLENGNLAALSNFTRLKCMVHKGAPIYSMEEAK
jgi:hypothetical protein